MVSAGFHMQLSLQGLAFERSWGDYCECLAVQTDLQDHLPGSTGWRGGKPILGLKELSIKRIGLVTYSLVLEFRGASTVHSGRMPKLHKKFYFFTKTLICACFKALYFV